MSRNAGRPRFFPRDVLTFILAPIVSSSRAFTPELSVRCRRRVPLLLPGDCRLSEFLRAFRDSLLACCAVFRPSRSGFAVPADFRSRSTLYTPRCDPRLLHAPLMIPMWSGIGSALFTPSASAAPFVGLVLSQHRHRDAVCVAPGAGLPRPEWPLHRARRAPRSAPALLSVFPARHAAADPAVRRIRPGFSPHHVVRQVTMTCSSPRLHHHAAGAHVLYIHDNIYPLVTSLSPALIFSLTAIVWSVLIGFMALSSVHRSRQISAERPKSRSSGWRAGRRQHRVCLARLGKRVTGPRRRR